MSGAHAACAHLPAGPLNTHRRFIPLPPLLASAPQERVLLQPPGSQEWLEYDKGMPVGPAAMAAAFPQQARGQGTGLGRAACSCGGPLAC